MHDDEVEQVYVDASARGSGTAATLLDRGEEIVAATYDRAWLAVVAGNVRARRFYERRGWVDAGPFDYSAETDDRYVHRPGAALREGPAASDRVGLELAGQLAVDPCDHVGAVGLVVERLDLALRVDLVEQVAAGVRQQRRRRVSPAAAGRPRSR